MPYIFDKTAKKKSPYNKNNIDADKEKQLRKA